MRNPRIEKTYCMPLVHPLNPLPPRAHHLVKLSRECRQNDIQRPSASREHVMRRMKSRTKCIAIDTYQAFRAEASYLVALMNPLSVSLHRHSNQGRSYTRGPKDAISISRNIARQQYLEDAPLFPIALVPRIRVYVHVSDIIAP